MVRGCECAMTDSAQRNQTRFTLGFTVDSMGVTVTAYDDRIDCAVR
jgi:hypothetical protein